MKRGLMAKIALTIPVLLTGLLSFAPALQAAAPDKYPRLASYYLKAGIGIPSSDHAALAQYDVIVLPAEAQVFNQSLFSEVRRLNPNVKILAYVATKSWANVWNDSLHDVMKADIAAHPEWRLRTPDGNPLSVWPNTFALNIASGWSDYLAGFAADRVMATGYWDGIFYDEASATISWLNGGNIDLDNNNQTDDGRTADRLWKDGMLRLLKGTRERIGAGKSIVINGDSDADLAPYTNGRMFESFPTPWEGNGSWTTVMTNYLRLQGQVGTEPLFIINGNTANTGNQADYKKVRFGLASTLLGDGYFGFDYGDQDHGQLWLYDEYKASLGKPLGGPTNMLSGSAKVQPGVWKREFERGIIMVNSTDKTQSVELDRDFERLHGAQDPQTNNGSVESLVDLPPNDGLIMLRPLDKIVGAAYKNGAFTRVFDGLGTVRRTGFFAYDNREKGGAVLAAYDSPTHGRVNLSARGNHLDLKDANGNLLKTAYPFGEGWKPAVGFSIGQAGGKYYVVAVAGSGGAPQVRLYNDVLEPLTDAWNAYDAKFKGGVNAAVGDLDGDGRLEVVTGAGPGGGPHVRVFNLDRSPKTQFFAYETKFKGGVNVAVGDFDGDGLSEIATGTGYGGAPQVKIFSGTGKLERSFYAYDSKKRGGVRVAANDLDLDGRPEIMALSNDVLAL